MTRKKAFNHLFENGMNYQVYTSRSDRHDERMEKSQNAARNYLDKLDNEKLEQLNYPLKVLCIAENWCGDCGNGVPVINELASRITEWNFSIVPRDDFEDIVELHYTTAGRKKIPVVVFADEDGDEIDRWIERPQKSYEKLVELKSKDLPKEEYIEAYKSAPELKPPVVVENILDELIFIAAKSSTMAKLLPNKRE